MPILLTTPGDPGESDPEASYPRVQVLNFTINIRSKIIRFTVGFGDVTEGVWVPGTGLKSRAYEITETDYDTIVAALSQDGEAVYDGAARLLYEWLQTADSRFAGTVE